MLCYSLKNPAPVFKHCVLLTAVMVVALKLVVIAPQLVNGAILERPQMNQIINNGSGFMVRCTTDLPDTSVVWTCYGLCSEHKPEGNHVVIVMDDEVQSAYSDRVKLIQDKIGQKYLSVRFATVSDSGNYSCMDDGGIGEPASGVVIVSVPPTNNGRVTIGQYIGQPERTPALHHYMTTSSVPGVTGQNHGSTNWIAIIVCVAVLAMVAVVAVVVFFIFRQLKLRGPHQPETEAEAKKLQTPTECGQGSSKFSKDEDSSNCRADNEKKDDSLLNTVISEPSDYHEKDQAHKL